MTNGTSSRQYPALQEVPGQRVLPITFLTVRFSGEYEHNILRSECVGRAPHQLVTVDNRGNLNFENLGQAINFGLSLAQHEIVAIVHEDVLLVRHWDQHLWRCLDALDSAGAAWGLLASKGRARFGLIPNPHDRIGHWSEPDRYCDTMRGECFAQAGRVDEHLMVVRKSVGLQFDPQLPSIHMIGVDLPLTLRQRGLSTYVINAPTIHKYADAQGKIIESGDDSPKAQSRKRLPFKAAYSLARDHVLRKWPELANDMVSTGAGPQTEPACIDAPLIVTGKGGGGTRLASVLAQDLGVFLGKELNLSGDTLGMALPIYRGVLRSLLDSERAHRHLTPGELRAAAVGMLASEPSTELWGIKLPEAMLLLPELLVAFPAARVLHVVRDPLHTCLRRTHLTARMCNEMGRTTLPAAYRHVGRQVGRIFTDSPAIHMACSAVHQIETALSTLDALPPHRCLQVKFEDLVSHPRESTDHVARWLRARPTGTRLVDAVDPLRARATPIAFPDDVVAEASEILAPLRRRLGYLP